MVPQRRKDGGGCAGHALHAGALDVDQRHVLNRGKAADRQGLHGGCLLGEVADAGARGVKVEEVADDDGDAILHRRQRGARVQHIGAKVRQLPGLVVRHGLQAHRLGHLTGVCRVDTVNVCPDADLPAARERAKYCGRVVRAISPESGDLHEDDTVARSARLRWQARPGERHHSWPSPLPVPGFLCRVR